MKGERSKASIKGQANITTSSKRVGVKSRGTEEPANNNISGAGEVEQRSAGRRARSADRQLFSKMSPSQIRCAERIALGFQLRTAGLGFRTQSFSRQPSAISDNGSWQFELMQNFMGWARRTEEDGLSLSAALDILVFGKSCRAVDRARRKRNGFTKQNLMESLELFEVEYL